MWKYRRFRTTMTNKPMITEEYLKTFIVRKPTGGFEKMHPSTKRTFNRMTQQPEPLTYKLKDIPDRVAKSHYEIEDPLGHDSNIPFYIARTYTNNLPVYTQYKNSRTGKFTIVRHITGDVEEFKKEISKIVSNALVTHATGKVVVNGLHAEKIKLWLRRLGF